MHDVKILSRSNPNTGYTITAMQLPDSAFFENGALIINCLDIPVDIGGNILASTIAINAGDRPVVKYETAWEDQHKRLGINNIVPKIYGMNDVLDTAMYLAADTDEEVLILASMKIVEVAETLYEDAYDGLTFCGIDKFSSEKKGTHIKINKINFYDYDLDNNPFSKEPLNGAATV